MQPIYKGASISAVNLAEVASKYAERGMPIDDVRRLLESQPLDIVPFAGEQIFEAARLRGLTHHEGLSLADRACLALARMRGAPVWTTDRSWRSLKLGVDVQVFR